MTLAVTLTIEELRELVRQAVREELRAVDPQTPPQVTEESIARARKSLRRFGRG